MSSDNLSSSAMKQGGLFPILKPACKCNSKTLLLKPLLRNSLNFLQVYISRQKHYSRSSSVLKANRVKRVGGVVRSSTPWARKRRRVSTPPEELDSDREGRFVMGGAKGNKESCDG
ncbi:uncharacterized protein RSE6_14819 [Rhynchosporium secalis]|uniref:Uncharacterized protein n=1 Tax=Rhynchosporium secalis TaxID=38038 RepID=A0A1E1MW70_RHYSE|nr:uncharacterized protein RSE6_14819 [Rhynchosporium secalis]